jgi:inhibitor of cysteine peptidase
MRRRPPATAAIIAVLALLGCTANQSPAAPPPPQQPQTTSIDVSYDDLLNQKFITRSTTLAVGDMLKVTLASNASTGFSWSADARISDPGVVQQTSHNTVAPTAGVLGAAGTEVWTFTAVTAGSATVTTDYSQPWPGGTKGSWTFTADVTVH